MKMYSISILEICRQMCRYWIFSLSFQFGKCPGIYSKWLFEINFLIIKKKKEKNNIKNSSNRKYLQSCILKSSIQPISFADKYWYYSYSCTIFEILPILNATPYDIRVSRLEFERRFPRFFVPRLDRFFFPPWTRGGWRDGKLDVEFHFTSDERPPRGGKEGKLSGRMQYSGRPRRQRMSSARETGYPNEIQYGNAEIISRGAPCL